MDTKLLDPAVLDQGFDTALIGTPEHQWRMLLAGSPQRPLISGPVLVVAPHPDDETLAAGGLLASQLQAQIISVTDGEAADRSHLRLATQRRGELCEAVRRLRTRRINVNHLALPDGQVARHERRLERLLRPYMKPGVTVVAPFERDGHPDHDAVGRVCANMARGHHLTLLRYLIWGWHQQMPAAFRANQFVRYPLTARARHRKQRAISCFDSQLQGGMHAVLPPHVLAYFDRPYEAFLR